MMSKDMQRTILHMRTLASLAVLTLAAMTAQGQQGNDALVGNTERGQQYFTAGYKCYACHGYDAQSGARRLLPLNYTQGAFISFVQNSPLPQMPAYNDMPAQALADVYSYIRSIPADAPEIDAIPLLGDIRQRQLEALDE